MCVNADFTKPTITTRTTYAYKVVHRSLYGSYRSFIWFHDRILQPGFSCSGSNIEYEIGKCVRSRFPYTPGLYCYKTKPKETSIDRIAFTVLKVRIPKGTKVVYGKTFLWPQGDILTVNAETIVPIEKVV